MDGIVQAALFDELPADCRAALERAWSRLGRTGDGSAYRETAAPVSRTGANGVSYFDLGDGELFVRDPSANDDPGTTWKVFGGCAGVLGIPISIIGVIVSRGTGKPAAPLLIGVAAIVLGVVLFVYGRHRQKYPPDWSARGLYFLSIGILTNKADVYEFVPRALVRRAEHKRTGDVSSPAHTIVWYEGEFGEASWVSLGNRDVVEQFDQWRAAHAE